MNTQDQEIADTGIPERAYSINRKPCIQRPLSPFQLMRLSDVLKKIGVVLKQRGIEINLSKDFDGEVNLTPYVEALEDRPELLAALLNVIIRNPEDNRPGYKNNYLNADDFEAINPVTLVEVVADFFTLNDVMKLLHVVSQVSGKINSMMVSLGISKDMSPNSPQAKIPQTGMS